MGANTVQMGSIGRYIVRTALGAFVLTLAFHATNHSVFFTNIGWFPFIAVAVTTYLSLTREQPKGPTKFGFTLDTFANLTLDPAAVTTEHALLVAVGDQDRAAVVLFIECPSKRVMKSLWHQPSTHSSSLVCNQRIFDSW